MAITFTEPAAAQAFGPGYLFSASTSIAGPYPAGSYWRAFLQDTADTNSVCSYYHLAPSSSILGHIGIQDPQTGLVFATTWSYPIGPVQTSILNGANGHLNLALIDGSTGLPIDSGTQNVVIDWVNGVAVMFAYLNLVLQNSTITGDLSSILAAVKHTFPTT